MHAAALHAEVRGAAPERAPEGLVREQVLGAQGQAGTQDVVFVHRRFAVRGAAPRGARRGDARRREPRALARRVHSGVTLCLRDWLGESQGDEREPRVIFTQRLVYVAQLEPGRVDFEILHSPVVLRTRGGVRGRGVRFDPALVRGAFA
jgi:hypothetical protein